MSKLTRLEILKQVHTGRIVVSPFKRENVGPNSVDLTLSNEIMWYKGGEPNPPMSDIIDMKKDNEVFSGRIPHDGLMITPGVLYLGATNERAGSDFYATTIAGRSSVGRLGLFVHVTAGFGDLGFKGHWTLEMLCHHPIIIYPNVRICQVAFETVVGDIGSNGYSSEFGHKYGEQLSAVPVPSKLFMDKELNPKKE